MSTLIFDGVGNLYGTASAGGAYRAGTVFELSPTGGGWHETTLYTFGPHSPQCPDGAALEAGLVMDATGNLFGTTYNGGANDAGAVFDLSRITHPTAA
jgi:uncharacterized repeat protein (TIGR03803 family)